MNLVAIICARGGSKGLPGKNVRPLAGKPLIAWAIESAKSISRVRRVIVSTDSKEIASIAREFGGEVPFMRPTELASDNSPEWLSWRHALNFIQVEEGALPDAMLSVPATSPLRLSVDLENCIDEFERNDADVVITVTEAHRNPWFNMVKFNLDGSVHLAVDDHGDITRRQDAPSVFDMTTVAYVADAKFVMVNNGVFNGRVRAVKIPKERSIDIDTLIDFEIAEFFLSRSRNKTEDS
jgi:CMP-N-acetylneuraminic acid synthetase